MDPNWRSRTSSHVPLLDGVVTSDGVDGSGSLQKKEALEDLTDISGMMNIPASDVVTG
jgi:hypothetical protein